LGKDIAIGGILMSKKKYVILPSRGVQARATTLSSSTISLFHALQPAPGAQSFNMTVLDSIRHDGAKLVEINEKDIHSLRQAHPDLQIVPIVYYEIARAPTYKIRASPSSHVVGRTISGPVKFKILDAVSATPIEKVRVVAFTDFENRFGAEGTTDSNGEVELSLGNLPVNIERLYFYPPLSGFWGRYEENVMLNSSVQVQMEPIQFPFIDSARYFHGSGQSCDGLGIKVAAIDTGVGPHPDLVSNGDVDNGDGHGTHVAGIIAAKGDPSKGMKGIAPGVTLQSYRVFSVPGGMSANFSIAKAIDQAVVDGCDLINMSLKIDQRHNPSGFAIDPVVQAAIEDAWDAGVLCICAAGNDSRTSVDFPARDPKCIAVSALGRIGTFPTQSLADADIAMPPGNDPNDFIAAFSNKGPEIDLTAAGVGVISTVPGGYGMMSGTSMACPATTAVAAKLIAQDSNLKNMQRNAQRTASMAKLVLSSLRTLGFPSDLEGGGVI
jgi:subtilisin